MLLAFAAALVVTGIADYGGELSQFMAVRVKVSNLVAVIGFGLLWHFVFRSMGLYRSRRIGSTLAEAKDLLKAVTLGSASLAAIGLLLDLEAINRNFVLTFAAVAFVGSVLFHTTIRIALGEARRHGRNLRNVAIVGCGRRGAAIGKELRQRPDLGYLLLGYIDDLEAPSSSNHTGKEKLLGSLDQLEQLLDEHEIDELFVTLPLKSYYERISQIITLGEDLGVTVRMPADFFNLELAKAEVDYLDQVPVMTLKTPSPTTGGLVFKRMFDFMAAATALFFLAPLFIGVAIAIKFDSKGPVFFRQERVGFNRRLFKMIKFRTMVQDAENRVGEVLDLNEVQGAALKIKNDPRITRVGKWLRKTSIDELPQLWNVLLGQMSIVGPRPLPVRDVNQFDQRWLKRRFSVKPGLTCLWQANGRHNIAFDEWMQLDLQYIDSWSLSLDFEIMLKTVPAVLRGTGAS